jgi:hypothetical protein
LKIAIDQKTKKIIPQKDGTSSKLSKHIWGQLFIKY